MSKIARVLFQANMGNWSQRSTSGEKIYVNFCFGFKKKSALGTFVKDVPDVMD